MAKIILQRGHPPTTIENIPESINRDNKTGPILLFVNIPNKVTDDELSFIKKTYPHLKMRVISGRPVKKVENKKSSISSSNSKPIESTLTIGSETKVTNKKDNYSFKKKDKDK